WTLKHSYSGDMVNSMTLEDISFGNGIFTAVGQISDFMGMGNGVILTSTDAETWKTAVNVPFVSLRSVSFINNKFIAVGNNSTIYTSSDAVTWTKLTLDNSMFYNFADISYGNHVYVALGYGGDLWTSTDEINWTAQDWGNTNPM